MRRVIGCATPAVLAAMLYACAPVDATQTARTQLVGMPKADFVSCAGEPTRDRYFAGKEELTYVRTEKHDNKTFTCTAEILFYRGHVEHVSYSGIERPIFGPETPCSNIVNTCLR